MEETLMKERIEDYKCLMKALNEGEILYYHKLCLSLEEAAKYTGIGIHKMRALVDRHEDLIFWNGSKRLIKRRKLEEYLEKEYSI